MPMVLIKVPSSEGNLNKNLGCEKAPNEIVKDLEGLKIEEAKVVKGNLSKTFENIEKTKGAIFVGGDHSITYASFKGFAKDKKNPGLLIFDAHLDCDYYTETPTHEDFVRKLVDEKIVKKENVIFVGVRKTFEVEEPFVTGMKVFRMKNLFNNIEISCDGVMELCRAFSDFYLSIDIDVVDPAFAPGTGYQEPGGLSSSEILYFIRRLKLLKNLKRADVVEVNPDKDINGRTVKLAAEIINELK